MKKIVCNCYKCRGSYSKVKHSPRSKKFDRKYYVSFYGNSTDAIEKGVQLLNEINTFNEKRTQESLEHLYRIGYTGDVLVQTLPTTDDE